MPSDCKVWVCIIRGGLGRFQAWDRLLYKEEVVEIQEGKEDQEEANSLQPRCHVWKYSWTHLG